MKKIIIASTIIGLFTFSSATGVHAEEPENFVISTRAAKYKQYNFSSYPPKKYNRLTLRQVYKTINGYTGIYS